MSHPRRASLTEIIKLCLRKLREEEEKRGKKTGGRKFHIYHAKIRTASSNERKGKIEIGAFANIYVVGSW